MGDKVGRSPLRLPIATPLHGIDFAVCAYMGFDSLNTSRSAPIHRLSLHKLFDK